MNILHISAECYPAAKVGGLADVVGALPKYQNQQGSKSQVIMPFYDNPFTESNEFETVFTNIIQLGTLPFEATILSLKDNTLGFDLFFVDIPELLFKSYVYSIDDTDRFLAFQIAVLDWVLQADVLPQIIHCHDHHTGLIPFMLSHSKKYARLKRISSVFTIHNAQYQGWFAHQNVGLIPEFPLSLFGLLDWDNCINPLATAIKCAWHVTTVSPSYMEELKVAANGLESLIRSERDKCSGILNGIDSSVWDPKTDTYLSHNYSEKTVESGKAESKKWLCDEFNLKQDQALVVFIGRLVGEKGADLFPEVFDLALKNAKISILLLGSGNETVEKELTELKENHVGVYNAYIGYDESLSHKMYAGADFLLMPSRVEPCGLNQMYSLRYGTIPVVSSVGGLKDTVVDIDNDGFGICHENITVDEIVNAIERAAALYAKTKEFNKIRQYIMRIDHSWGESAKQYINLYKTLIKKS